MFMPKLLEITSDHPLHRTPPPSSHEVDFANGSPPYTSPAKRRGAGDTAGKAQGGCLGLTWNMRSRGLAWLVVYVGLVWKIIIVALLLKV
jgi:hypothetical protein